MLEVCGRQLSTPHYERALAAVRSAVASIEPEEAAEVTGNGITAHEAVAAALCAALPRLGDPEAAVAFAVQMGGDTDTIAAMAGSIAGAFAGAQAMQEQVLSRLEGREWMQEVAHRLAARSRGPLTAD